MLVLIWKDCILQYRCAIITMENDFLLKTSYKSKFCEIKNLIKKRKHLFDNVHSSKTILLYYIRTSSIFLYTHYTINVIYFPFIKKNCLVDLITLLTHFFTDANKYWLFHCLLN